MKPQATVDTKDISTISTTDMAPPIQIFQKENAEKKGVTTKHVLIAVTSLLALAIIIGGFIAGFYMLKQTSDKHSENMTKVFKLKVDDGKKVVNENIKTNVKEKTTEVDTKDDKGQDSIIYNDFKKGITVFVTGGENSACFVSPMNRSNVEDPETLEKYMETHPNPTINARNATKEDYHMSPSEEPIPDTTFLGSHINKMCSGKKIYWMYPKKDANDDSVGRQKRGCYYRIYRICKYYLIRYYGRYYIYKRCYYIRYRYCYRS